MGHGTKLLRRGPRTTVAAVAVGALATAGVTLGPATAARAAVSCEVTYTGYQWGSGSGGFTASIAVKNTGDPVTGWTLTFTFPGSQRLTQGWSAQWTQTGARVTATSPAWGGPVGAGSSFFLGFNGTWTGSNPPPTDFAINGVPCTVNQVPDPSPSVTPVTTPSATPTPPPLRIVISPKSIVVPEGGTAGVQVTLSQRPPGNVIVGTGRVAGDTDLTASAPLTFTPENWDVPQTITVTAAQDGDTTDGSATFDSRSSQITGSSAVLWTAVERDDDIVR
ncbi:cellulose binding domain-containing protein [Microbispora sp. ATCC PTA-5024]|uniref:cellulose binding domain-containing protein n=1 Tax=Microbispora sp. ATCC PTA-5024 TaxID=316330 RepID=UPI0003DC79C6|nr:cellulose binding domain-containing protein [Microbispora sp. ATCC PTA-5024]ETK34289.1 hypothetical protein MPTA5024_19915 [Microbispora sp. ATCC PTA-5024]